MEQPGTKDAYDFHLGEARASKWFRNVLGVGGLAATAAINVGYEMSNINHLEVSGGGVGLSMLIAWQMDRCRREALHDAHIDAALATIDAKISHRPVPSWAKGNTGKIFDRLEQTRSLERIAE